MAWVTMPQLGETVAEGTIGRWLKQVGDRVERGEPIVEVVTDKVNAEVPSDVAGEIREILVPEGASAAPGRAARAGGRRGRVGRPGRTGGSHHRGPSGSRDAGRRGGFRARCARRGR